MKSESLARQVIAVFLIAVVLYFLVYTGIENRRTRNGPWQVAFTNDASGSAAILIQQPKLGITNALIVFKNESFTNASAGFDFAQPHPVPFGIPGGQCLFMDTTFLPGTLVFQFFGHEIQLLPRVLTVDRKEFVWQTNLSIELKQDSSR